VKQGPGKITVNGKDHVAYFARPVLQMIVKQPLVSSKREGQFDVICTVSGGGLSGQAGRCVIACLALRYEPAPPVLKKGGFLTRDAHTVSAKVRQDQGPKELQFSG
jgi:small subunit ribosomal protein S9